VEHRPKICAPLFGLDCRLTISPQLPLGMSF
jgi:hypothetical protein